LSQVEASHCIDGYSHYLNKEIAMMTKTILAAAVVAAISTGMVGSTMSQAFAADTQPQAAQESMAQKKMEEELIKVSEDAAMTVRDLRGARLAIFNGTPSMAQVYTDAAAKRAEAALKDVERYALDIKKPLKDGDEYVPFNASLVVAESFVPDAAKSKDIAKANKHLHKGETKKAMEALKLGGIDVALTTELVPLKWAKSHVDDAARLIGEGKYYEANLALKAVDDAVVIETFDVYALPKTKSGS
jgi:hypothetical protein